MSKFKLKTVLLLLLVSVQVVEVQSLVYTFAYMHLSQCACKQANSSFHCWYQACVAELVPLPQQLMLAHFRVLTDDATVVVTTPPKKKRKKKDSATRVSHADWSEADSVSTNTPYYSCCGRWRLACTVSSRAMWPACVTYFWGPPPWQLATKDPLSRGSDKELWWVICMRL